LQFAINLGQTVEIPRLFDINGIELDQSSIEGVDKNLMDAIG